MLTETSLCCCGDDFCLLHLFDVDPLGTFFPCCKADVVSGLVDGGVAVAFGLSIKVCFEV